MPRITVFFPEKDDVMIKMDVESDATIEDITEQLSEKFITGADRACYLKASPVDPFLSPKSTIADVEPLIKLGGNKLFGYIRLKQELDQGPEKSIELTLKLIGTYIVLGTSIDSTLKEISSIVKQKQNLHDFAVVEFYLEGKATPLDKNKTLRLAGIDKDATLIVKIQHAGAR